MLEDQPCASPLVLLAFSFSAHIAAQTPAPPILSAMGLSAEKIAAVEAGRPVAKVLPWGGPSEVYVFGAVHVDGTLETVLESRPGPGASA